ncbi:hypothetical protein RFI_04886 [Reticulomyxa filosa]|uniref:ATP citrate synthase n=1 Tax=Reticulomyxa filosa TaxID=46433 RepID=X6P2C9_RETFI|nr:hypothetical protein RFI_04886 [Reticulomyxa filosa]|eukprot:ETO32229.1 hypothetical protein RFI_04886 [Reticulomyxa filosa]
MFLVTPETKLDQIESPFDTQIKKAKQSKTKTNQTVVKPDQLLKRRGKLGLVKLNATWKEACQWVSEVRNKKITVDGATDELNYFLVESFIPHKPDEELYLCIHSIRDGDEILFYHQGGVDVGDVDAKVARELLSKIENNQKRDMVSEFIEKIFQMYSELHFCYLEINPLVVLNDLSGVFILDLAAKLDSAAEFQCHSKWSDVVEFPPFFGHHSSPEEKFVEELDERTGASLKLTVLNPTGRVWTMVAGGGASVIYADTVADLGFAHELGNYGEYSGAPTQELTYQYANTLLRCMLKYPREEGKILLIGGGIANFTDVADTFTGVIQALQENKDDMIKQKTKIYVRRGGPNYQRGLKLMKECADSTGLDMQVFGPETHITAIVSMALLSKKDGDEKEDNQELQDVNIESYIENLDLSRFKWNDKWEEVKEKDKNDYVMTEKTKAIVYGMQVGAVQVCVYFFFSLPKEKGLEYTYSQTKNSNVERKKKKILDVYVET